MISLIVVLVVCFVAVSVAFAPSRRFRSAFDARSCIQRPSIEVQREFAGQGNTKLYMGDQALEFRPEKDNDSFESKVINAEIGAELSVVAEAADIPIAYQCRKGECGTCEVNMNGKWVRTCQTQIPAMSKDEDLVVIVKKVKKKPAKFFSPKSFAEGVFNNGLGVVGFVYRGARSGKEFSSRIEREQEIEAMVAKKKAEKAGSTNT